MAPAWWAADSWESDVRGCAARRDELQCERPRLCAALCHVGHHVLRGKVGIRKVRQEQTETNGVLESKREKGQSLCVDGVSACVPWQSSARLVVLRGQWRDFATHLDALGLLVHHGSDGRGDVGSPLDLLNVLRLLSVGTRRCVRTNPTRSARCRKAHGGGGRRGHLGGDLRCGGLAGGDGWLRGGRASGGLVWDR
jgi:hypothetical protein